MVKNYNIAKQTSNFSWDNFLSLTKYKQARYDCKIKTIDRILLSYQRYFHCGYIRENLTLNVHEWECLDSATHLNTATNIIVLFAKFKIPMEGRKSTPEQPVARLGINCVSS
ncbi:transposase, IS605 OrfB family protein [Cylindrospermum sp. NIES-4074]|nr:transposase, IS605 OrfB family protein [Cylindrospermum sp. NIES-4074]